MSQTTTTSTDPQRGAQVSVAISGFAYRLRRALHAQGHVDSVDARRMLQQSADVSAVRAMHMLWGNNSPSRRISDSLADVLDVDREWLFHGKTPATGRAPAALLASQAHARRGAYRVVRSTPATQSRLHDLLKGRVACEQLPRAEVLELTPR